MGIMMMSHVSPFSAAWVALPQLQGHPQAIRSKQQGHRPSGRPSSLAVGIVVATSFGVHAQRAGRRKSPLAVSTNQSLPRSAGNVTRRYATSSTDAKAEERFSQCVVDSIPAAFRIARRFGHLSQDAVSGIGTDHLLIGMAATPGSTARRALLSVGVTQGALEQALLKIRPQSAKQPAPAAVESLSVPMSAETVHYLQRAPRMLRQHRVNGTDGRRVLGTEHILLGLLSNGSHAAGRLLLAVDPVGFDRTVTRYDSGAGGSASNPRRAALRASVMQLVNSGSGDAEADGTQPKNTSSVAAAAKPTKGDDGFLARFTSNLTALAQGRHLDPYAGRDSLVDRVGQALGRRQKRSVLLVGEPGVGKTALVEALAQRISDGVAPSWLRDRKIHSLDVGALTAGTRLRGDFEERFSGVLREAERTGAVLFVDEAHTLIGAGATASSKLDAADMLKPALARGKLQCIAATTLEEYRSHFVRDAAFERRFEVVVVEEPSPQEAVDVLETLRPHYEKHHNAAFGDGVIKAAVEWASRYLPQRRLPDKAIDLLDGAAVLARATSEPPVVVNLEHVATVIENTMGLRPGAVSTAELERFFDLEKLLSERVHGQREAVSSLVSAIARERAGLQEDGRPIASLLFYGPPGVGKTSLAVALAETWLGSRQALIRFDCASAGEARVSREALAKAVRQRPHAVVLIDEADKADAALLDALLEILEAGSLSMDGPGGLGRADFQNTVVLLTSNNLAGVDAFPWALADRLDNAIRFQQLSHAELDGILSGLIVDVEQRLQRRHPSARLHATDSWREMALAAANSASEQGDGHQQGGARPLRRVMRQLLEDPISKRLLHREAASDVNVLDLIIVDVGADGAPSVELRDVQA